MKNEQHKSKTMAEKQSKRDQSGIRDGDVPTHHMQTKNQLKKESNRQ